jgi:hypothetical protein
MLDSLAVRGSRAHAGFWRDCETSYAAAPYKNNAIAASQCAEACDVGCGSWPCENAGALQRSRMAF